MPSSVDNPRPIDTGEIIFSSSGRRVEDDYFHGVFFYLNKMLMEEDDLANKPCMLIDSLALQATEKSFYNVLVEDQPHIQETELLKIYDTALLCEELTHLWLHNPCSGSFHGITDGNAKKKRKTIVVEGVDLTELLIQCAQKVASFEMNVAIEILKTMRKHSSPKGSSSERMAHYFANAIEARLGGTGMEVYLAFSANVSAFDILKSYKAYITACPFQRMSNIYANKSIGKLANGRDKLHIIDFGISYGFQWPCIIQGLSLRPGGPPKLRITGIDLPQPGIRPDERVKDTGRRLAEYAKRFNVPFKYNSIAKNWENVRMEDLEINPEEILVVNSIYRMRNVPDETVVENGSRDGVLKFIRELNPDMFVHGILNGTYNATYFLTRFKEAVFHFTTLFDMFEATSEREDIDRELFEREVFGRDILNAVACEGRSRVERPETYQKWETRNSQAGFVQLPLDSNLMDEVRTKVEKKYHKDFVVHEDNNWMLQGWKGKDVHTLLIQHRRAQMIKQKLVYNDLSVDSFIKKANGLCPLMPEEAYAIILEVGLLLRAMGYPPTTRIYLAGSERFGGQRVMIPLRAMYTNLVDRSNLCSKYQLNRLLGTESLLPLNHVNYTTFKTSEDKEWAQAGPRPRPLPPPPGRPIYRHEKEGWYGWIAEKDSEPDPSPIDLRDKAHRLLWDALDYVVSVEADAFFPGFNNDGTRWPDFSSLVMGHRLYEMASSLTYRPDRKFLANLFNSSHDNLYFPSRNWTLAARKHLNNSLGEEGLKRQLLQSKPNSFLSHPLPECSCTISKPVGNNECPKWLKDSFFKSRTQDSTTANENEQPDDETDEEEMGSDDEDGTSRYFYFDQDQEMDPND